MVLNGQDFRGWPDRRLLDRTLGTVAAAPADAKIALAAQRDAAGVLQVNLDAQLVRAPTVPAEAYLAVYENGLVSDVRAGENKGVRLAHDFVVREWIGPLPLDAQGRVRLARALPARTDIDYSKAGVAAFVQTARGDVLQALALPLCKG